MKLSKYIKPVIAILLIFSFVFSASACGKIDIIDKLKEKFTNKTEDVSTTENTTEYYTEIYTQPETTEEITTAPVTTTKKATQSSKPTTTKAPAQQATEAVAETGVGQYSGTYNSIEQVVYYPNSIKSSKKTLPVIAWANGTGCTYTLYENLLKEIAAGGYIVVANGETMAADGTAQIASLDFILSENNNSSSILYNKVNTSKLGVAGHSQGGRSSVNAAVKDSRIDCVLSLAGSNYLEEAEPLSTPAFFMTGTKDMIVSSSKWVKPAYDVSKGPAVYASLINGIHTTCCSDPGKYSNYIIKWFDIYLKGDNSAKAIFKSGGELSKDSAWTDFACKGL